MRRWVSISIVVAACATPEPPAQDPLDYLRVGVNHEAEADAVIADLELHGFTVGRKVVEARYTAFDATRGPDSTVRVVTRRGPSFSAQTPDVRAPRRVRLALAPDPRPDVDEDGVRDIIIAAQEMQRTCLVWLQVGEEGFVTSVFQPDPRWGDLPCVLDLDPQAKRVWLEVIVPRSTTTTARVIVPVRRESRGWVLDEGAAAQAHWAREVDRRNAVRAAATDDALRARMDAELAWIDQLRSKSDAAEASEGAMPEASPMLEAADDGEEAR